MFASGRRIQKPCFCIQLVAHPVKHVLIPWLTEAIASQEELRLFKRYDRTTTWLQERAMPTTWQAKSEQIPAKQNPSRRGQDPGSPSNPRKWRQNGESSSKAARTTGAGARCTLPKELLMNFQRSHEPELLSCCVTCCC